ncbi:MAG: 23S rRNA (adenine(2503)-C(2))-methyltransferase RlmN [Verrucomicrobiota bacterium]
MTEPEQRLEGASRESLYGFNFEQLQGRLAVDGVNPVHAKSLWGVLYRELEGEPGKRTEYAPPLARWLEEQFPERLFVEKLGVSRHVDSADTRTHKLLLRLGDLHEVETVVMGYPGRHTVCLSTQVGCAMGCVFCATGQMGFTRHLSASEIVAQVIEAQRLLRSLGEPDLRNLVMMGMGEPLHNYDAVMQALSVISNRAGLNIGPTRMTVSTVGVVPGILRMAREKQPYHLAVSLHGMNDEERSALLPINRRWPLAELLEACREYIRLTERRIIFGWTLIEGRNDSLAHARQLSELLKGLDAHVNLIRLNPTAGFEGVTPGEAAANAFRAEVQALGFPCTIRQHRGIDVDAGCGQLKASTRS